MNNSISQNDLDAWEKVRKEVGTEGWTAGESAQYFGFFMHGRRSVDAQQISEKAFVSCLNITGKYGSEDARAIFEEICALIGAPSGESHE